MKRKTVLIISIIALMLAFSAVANILEKKSMYMECGVVILKPEPEIQGNRYHLNTNYYIFSRFGDLTEAVSVGIEDYSIYQINDSICIKRRTPLLGGIMNICIVIVSLLFAPLILAMAGVFDKPF